MTFIIIIFQLLFMILMQIMHTNALQKRIFYIFSLIWCGILILGKTSISNAYQISTEAYILIWLFLLSFDISFIFLGNKKPVKNVNYNAENILFQYDNTLRSNKVLICSTIIITIVLLVYAVRYSEILLTDVLSARTTRYFVGRLFRSTIELLFYNYIVSMFAYLFSFIICFSILFHRMKTFMFWISVFDFALFMFIGAGRFPVVMFAFNFIVLFLIKYGFEKRTQKTKTKIKNVLSTFLIVVVAFIAMSYATSIRLGGSLRFNMNDIKENASVLFEQIVRYNTTSVKGLSYLLDEDIMQNHIFFGRAAVIGGIDEIFGNLLSWIGIPFRSASYVLGAISDTARVYGGESHNALYTCIYTFFSDSGIIGVLLFSGLFGFVVKKSIVHLINTPNIFNIMIVVHLTYFLFTSHLNWTLVNTDSLIYILIICILDKKIQISAKRESSLIYYRKPS